MREQSSRLQYTTTYHDQQMALINLVLRYVSKANDKFLQRQKPLFTASSETKYLSVLIVSFIMDIIPQKELPKKYIKIEFISIQRNEFGSSRYVEKLAKIISNSLRKHVVDRSAVFVYEILKLWCLSRITREISILGVRCNLKIGRMFSKRK